jgi:hypothetical protein
MIDFSIKTPHNERKEQLKDPIPASGPDLCPEKLIMERNHLI